MEGVVTKWNPIDWVGSIESDGQFYIVRRDSFRRGTKLAEGTAVSFTFSNLYAGPTAHNVQPITQKSQG
jgi:cold shock CspA family protein